MELPTRHYVQKWYPTNSYPYPMIYHQTPSTQHQIIVNYKGETFTQGLNPNSGPFMMPIKNKALAYPTTHSIPGPYNQSYMKFMRYPY
jgi:hypothetical protein